MEKIEYPHRELTEKIIGAMIEVHRAFGPGLLEGIYETALCRELDLRGLAYRRQWPVEVEYKGTPLGMGYRIDILVEEKIVLELKTVDLLIPKHKAQLLTYLKLANLKVGLLANFNEALIKDGIVRLVN